MPRDADGLEQRLHWKLATLRSLRTQGIWLVDASVIGIYSPGGRRIAAGAILKQMIRDSYLRFVWPQVEQEPLEQIWVIGRTAVGPALSGLPRIDSENVISQPQDRFDGGARYRRDLERMVRAIRRGV
jgi:hypothetical protein